MDPDDAARLRQALDQAPDTAGAVTWNPNVNEEIVGIVTARDQVTSQFTETLQEHLVIQDEHGDAWHVFGRHTVLAKLIEKFDPRVGDRVAIRRLPNIAGKNYRLYKMVVERADDAEIPF